MRYGFRRKFRRSFSRARTRTRVIYRGARRSYRRGRQAYNGLRISRTHKNMIAGAVVFFVAFLFLPKFQAWCFNTWVKLRLPMPKE